VPPITGLAGTIALVGVIGAVCGVGLLGGIVSGSASLGKGIDPGRIAGSLAGVHSWISGSGSVAG
jgi:hypothetical protein